MKVSASIKRPARLVLFGLRNMYYRFFGTDDYRKFIIISRSRTGSNLLVSLLGSHPRIRALGEMFNRLHGRSPQWVWDRVFSHMPNRIELVGCKIFYYHPQDTDNNWVWDRIYNDTSIPIIHLTRENILRTYLSRQIADKTRVWHDRNGKNNSRADDRKVHLDPKACRDEFEKTESWERHTDECTEGHRKLRVTYEELTGPGQEECLDRIQRFLGVEPKELASGMKRQNAEGLSTLISNYDELETSLCGTRWEKFLSEPSDDR